MINSPEFRKPELETQEFYKRAETQWYMTQALALSPESQGIHDL